MGVRFECPNGHKLHVKTELVGKRGICPECQARFVVPAVDGVRVEAVEAPPDAVAAAVTDADANRPAPVAPAATGATATAEPIMWYVRPAAGGQFGPASSEAFQQWIGEGRVAPDSWVWRTGWDQWKPGSEALASLVNGPAAPPAVAPAAPVAVILPAAAAQSPVEPSAGAARVETATAEARRAEIRRRKKRIQSISATLAVIAALLVVVMIVVLSR